MLHAPSLPPSAPDPRPGSPHHPRCTSALIPIILSHLEPVPPSNPHHLPHTPPASSCSPISRTSRHTQSLGSFVPGRWPLERSCACTPGQARPRRDPAAPMPCGGLVVSRLRRGRTQAWPPAAAHSHPRSAAPLPHATAVTAVTAAGKGNAQTAGEGAGEMGREGASMAGCKAGRQVQSWSPRTALSPSRPRT